MSNDLNQCQFIGRLGKDPETRYMPNGDAICSFSIGTSSKWKDKAGEKHEATEWVNITAFGKLAEICAEYLKKGQQVFVSGKIKTDKYEKDGITRYSTKIIIDNMQMLGSKPESKPAQQEEKKTDPVKQDRSSFDDMKDSIPF